MSNQETKDGLTPISSSSTTRNQPTITPDREKMSRALGAAFLQHKVQQLERNLERNMDDLSFRRDTNPGTASRSHPSNSASRRPFPQGQSKFKTKQTSPHPPSSISNPRSSISNNPVPIKIIDTSILIHALPLLKKWTYDGRYKLIIPLDVISELDFLKTSPPPIHGLVREATGWLDSQFKNSNNQITASTADKPCIVPQRTGDETRWDELSKRFIAPPIEVASVSVLSSELAQLEEEGDVDQPEFINRVLVSTDLPQRYRSLLQCTLYYQAHAQPNQQVELVIFNADINETIAPAQLPSQSAEAQQSIRSASGTTRPKGSNETQSVKLEEEKERSDDKIVQLPEWADYFQLQVDEVSPSDLVKVNQSVRNHNQKRNKPHNTHHRRSAYHHHSAPAHQESRASPSHQPSPKPIPRTIQILTRKKDPCPSSSSDQQVLHL